MLLIMLHHLVLSLNMYVLVHTHTSPLQPVATLLAACCWTAYVAQASAACANSPITALWSIGCCVPCRSRMHSCRSAQYLAPGSSSGPHSWQVQVQLQQLPRPQGLQAAMGWLDGP